MWGSVPVPSSAATNPALMCLFIPIRCPPELQRWTFWVLWTRRRSRRCPRTRESACRWSCRWWRSRARSDKVRANRWTARPRPIESVGWTRPKILWYPDHSWWTRLPRPLSCRRTEIPVLFILCLSCLLAFCIRHLFRRRQKSELKWEKRTAHNKTAAQKRVQKVFSLCEQIDRSGEKWNWKKFSFLIYFTVLKIQLHFGNSRVRTLLLGM